VTQQQLVILYCWLRLNVAKVDKAAKVKVNINSNTLDLINEMKLTAF